ncbi:Sporulation and spore germination [Blastococcus fimeti]|nr:Sporulation and spore germination [Blastococcus fimeti]
MRRRTGLPALAAALLLGISACSIVPTSSPTVPITQAPTRPVQDVGFEPLPPAPGATPEEVVRGFIDAAGSRVRGRPVAAEYLAPDAARTWTDATSITIVSQGYATVAGEAGSVEVTAARVGSVDPRGSFAVAGADPYTYAFPLAEVGGEWRITDPPDTLVMLDSDFERVYDRVDAYFLDPTLTQLVPDPRYLIRGEAQPTALVERLIEGAAPTLAPGVENPLTGARLARTVTVEDSTARVDLAGLMVEPATPLRELCAQLVWTLTQLDDLGIRSVEISVDGEPLELEDVPQRQTIDDWSTFDPEATPLPAVGHYLDETGALRRVTDGQPAPGPAGQAGAGLTSAAASADPRTGELTFLVGVRPEPGSASLLRGRYAGELAPVPFGGGTLSSPTVAVTSQEIWLLRNGVEIVRVSADGAPQGVGAPTLSTLGAAQVIELSPDGVRLAVVAADARGVRRLYVGTVVQDEEPRFAVRDFIEVTPGLSSVVDVAWRSAGELWVLAGEPGEQQLYSVFVDGWDLATEGRAGLPARPTALAAAPGRPPLVVAGDSLWQWSGQRWVTLLRGQEPVRGSAPFYPL